jgi:hypothetical protein
MALPATVRKTFHDIKTVGLPAFQEARRYIEGICTGYVDPQEVHRLAEKAKRLMESRRAQARKAKRPGNFLQMRGNAEVVRRPSGLIVPTKYRDV